MLIKIKHYLSRFDIKDALVLSILIHGILITDLLILKFDDAKKNKESIDFEAVLLSKNIPEPIPPSEEQASEKPESEVIRGNRNRSARREQCAGKEGNNTH